MPNDSKDSKNEALFDTSILVYAYDKSEPVKREICSKLVEEVFNKERAGYISNQILAELYFVLTEKKGLTKEEAKTIVSNFIESNSWMKVDYDTETVKQAMNSSKTIDVIFWDILIAETMKENGIDIIYTENENDFKKIPGIKVINPIK